MGPFRRRFRQGRAGGIDLRLPSEERAVLRSLAPQLRELLEDPSDPAIVRLFPPAHPDDAEQQAQYQAMVGDELVASRRAALATFETSVDADHLDDEAVSAWMHTINAARLVPGDFACQVTPDAVVITYQGTPQPLAFEESFCLAVQFVPGTLASCAIDYRFTPRVTAFGPYHSEGIGRVNQAQSPSSFRIAQEGRAAAAARPAPPAAPACPASPGLRALPGRPDRRVLPAPRDRPAA